MKKCVFVTGATNGTGLTIAKTFAKVGYNVILTSRDTARAEAAAAEQTPVLPEGEDFLLDDPEEISPPASSSEEKL